MSDRIALRMMRCPKCHSKHIDAFDQPYWYLCRDCGYNSPVSGDEAKAITLFCQGLSAEDGSGCSDACPIEGVDEDADT